MARRDSIINTSVSASVAVDIDSWLKKHGIDPKPIFAEAKIDTRIIEDPYEQLQLERYTYLLEAASRQANFPALGLELGAQQDPSKWGAFGYVVLNSPTVGAALNNMARFLRQAQSGTHMTYQRSETGFGIEYSIIDPKIDYKDQDAEFAIAYIKNVVDRLCGKSVSPLTVHFEHNPLSSGAIYEKLFQVQPQFDQPVNRISYDLRHEDRAVPSADLHLFPVIKQHLIDMARDLPYEQDLIGTVAYHIRQTLSSHQCRLETVADTLAVAPRTLQRHLKEHETSFAQILDEVRRELALRYMDNASMEIKEIGFLLGFADTSAFIKAFKKWARMTPGEYRGLRHKP
jgi:AraC-like DNA-binding protein